MEKLTEKESAYDIGVADYCSGAGMQAFEDFEGPHYSMYKAGYEDAQESEEEDIDYVY